MRRRFPVNTPHDYHPLVEVVEARVSEPGRPLMEVAEDAVYLARIAGERLAAPGSTTRGEAAIAASVLALADRVNRLIEVLEEKS